MIWVKYFSICYLLKICSLKACAAIGVCPKHLVDPADEITSSVPKKYNDILPTCGICTFTITKLVDMIGKNRTKVCYLIEKIYL